jgi:ElaB/YqjD/DUF883 family membrane-anchored ribosome-binding protein
MFDIAGLFTLETSMTKNAEGVAGDITADLAALRGDVARLAQTMSDLVQHQTQTAGLGVSEAVGDTRDKIASAAADVQNRVRAASGEIEARIERNPLTAMLIAFGIGISLGVINRSRA